MARPLTPLGELGGVVSKALENDGGARKAAILAARERLEAEVPSANQPLRRYLLPSAALAVAAGVLLWSLSEPRALRCEVNGAACAVNTPLEASSPNGLALSFSDGSSFALSPTSAARLSPPQATGADILLDHGRLSAQVVHTGKASWRVLAGPFTVKVTGTAFDAAWNPGMQSFALSVSAGSVVVSCLGQERVVRAGERVAADITSLGLAWQTGQPTRSVGAVSAAAAPSADLEAPPNAIGPIKTSGLDGADATWRALVKKGDLRGAFAAANARGFAAACEAASPSELLVLGDAARVSGRADHAVDALMALRRRYPKDARRAAAAFSLGKVAFDQLHDYDQAADWFAKCQREQPSGSLAREAAGRRIEALRNAGRAAAAGQAARDYLDRYPGGPHAELARAQLK